LSGPGWYRWDGATLELRIRAQPRARASAIVGPHGDSLRVRIAAPPVDGKANRALAALLAEEFGAPRGGIEIRRGQAARDKLVRIQSPGRIPAGLRELLVIA
jgi:uncharacterized protein (TIGR00251 family)